MQPGLGWPGRQKRKEALSAVPSPTVLSTLYPPPPPPAPVLRRTWLDYFGDPVKWAPLFLSKSDTPARGRRGFPSDSVVKNPPEVQEMQDMWVRSLNREDPLETEMATYSSILAWKLPWTEEPGGLQSVGSQRVRGDWAHMNAMHKGEKRVRYVTVRLRGILAPEKGPGEHGVHVVTPVGLALPLSPLALPETPPNPLPACTRCSSTIPTQARTLCRWMLYQLSHKGGPLYVTTCQKPTNQSTLPTPLLNSGQ